MATSGARTAAVPLLGGRPDESEDLGFRGMEMNVVSPSGGQLGIRRDSLMRWPGDFPDSSSSSSSSEEFVRKARPVRYVDYFVFWGLVPLRLLFKTRRFLHAIIESHLYNICIVVLVLLDLMCVLFELLIDLRVFQEISESGFCECEECPAPPFVNCTAIHLLASSSIASGGGGEHEDGEGEGFRPECKLAEEPAWQEHAAEVFWIISCTILSVFLLEIPVKMFALKWKFLYPSNLFDCVVVTVSWIFDLWFSEHEFVPLLITLRLWRLLRVGHGIIHFFEVKMERKMEKKVHHQERLRELAEESLEKEERLRKRAEHSIAHLRRRLAVLEGWPGQTEKALADGGVVPLPRQDPPPYDSTVGVSGVRRVLDLDLEEVEKHRSGTSESSDGSVSAGDAEEIERLDL